MPAFSFICHRCNKRFDKILADSDTTGVTCSFCNSDEVQRAWHSKNGQENHAKLRIPAGALSGGSCRNGFS